VIAKNFVVTSQPS